MQYVVKVITLGMPNPADLLFLYLLGFYLLLISLKVDYRLSAVGAIAFSFSSYFFLCDLDGHIEDSKVKKSLEELGLHCQDFHVLGVFEADKYRDK